MWNRIAKSSALALLLVGLATGAAQASQTIVNVPFSFVVHGRTLPAGEYYVERVEGDPNVMMIQARHGQHRPTSMFLTITASGQDPAGDKPSLTFTRRDNRYELATVWDSNTEGKTVIGN